MHRRTMAVIGIAIFLASCGPTAYQAYYRDCVAAGDPEHVCRYQAEMMRQQMIQTNVGIYQAIKPPPPPRTVTCTDLGGGGVSCQ